MLSKGAIIANPRPDACLHFLEVFFQRDTPDDFDVGNEGEGEKVELSGR